MKFYLQDYRTNKTKKISKSKAESLLSKAQMEEGIQAKYEDPCELVQYMTAEGYVIIDF